MRLLPLTALLLAAAPARADEWPQWLGPNRDGSSPDVVKPWKSAPQVVWRLQVGEGHSSPVVADYLSRATGNRKLGRVYIHTQGGAATAELVRGFVAESGERLWSDEYGRGPFTSLFGTGPRATPAVADGHLYTLGATGRLRCYDLDKVPQHAWEVDVLKAFNAPNLKFGVSASPLVEDDKVIVLAGGKGASLVAFNRATGAVAWKALDDPASYASPIAFDHGGRRQLVALTGEGVVALDPKTGELFWRQPFKDLLAESSTTPVHVGDLLVASSVSLGSVALKLGTADGKPTAAVAWKNPALSCYFSTPVAVGDKYLYMVTGSMAKALTGRAEADLKCVELASGKVLWTREKVGRYHAALLRTGDQKLLMLTDGGELVLIDPDPAGYRELARSKVCGECWAHPALANGKLYLRDNRELMCLQLGEAPSR
jgi:outer membrane protein assembly factor BamB